MKKFLSSTLAMLLFLISIVGTISFQFGIQNNAKNEQMINSDGYRIAQDNREIKKKNVTNKEKQIAALETNLAAQITTLDESIAEYRRLEKAQNQLYTFRISEINKKKTQLRAEFAGKMDNLNNELSTLSVSASADFKVSNTVELASVKGYLPLMEALSKWFDIDMTILTLVFQSLIACIFELTAIYLHIEDVSSKKSQSRKQASFQDASKPSKQPKKQATKPSKQAEVKPSNVILYKKKEQASNKISEELIQKYIKAKKQAIRENRASGIKALAKYNNGEIGISENQCREINLILKSRGILKSKVKEG